MGVLISKLRGKPSTKDLLEDLEKQISELEDYKRSTEQQQKRVIGSLIFYSILLYIFASAIFLLYYFPATTQERIIYSLPLLFFPVILYLFKRFLQWYFIQKIKNNEEQLIELKKKRRSLLEYAMETETYRVVKELLERFDPDYYKKVFESKPAIEAPPPPVPIKGSFAEMELRRRSPPAKGSSIPLPAPGQTLTINSAAGPSHIPPLLHGKPPTNIPFPPAFFQRNGQQFVRAPISSMPRPVLPRERTLVDRLVDYLVGDGPSNRYALICRQCQSHNGMALKEEFEFIAFRCCYCFTWNPPRSQQPPAPRLPLPAPSTSPKVTEPRSSASEASTSSGEDTEVEALSEADGSLTGETGAQPYNVEESPSRKSPTHDMDSLSSEFEIQASLEEDKTYTSFDQNEFRRTETVRKD